MKVLVGAFNKEKALVGTFPCRSESSRRLVGSSNNHYIGPRDPGVVAAEPRDNQLHNAPSADTAAAAFIEIRT